MKFVSSEVWVHQWGHMYVPESTSMSPKKSWASDCSPGTGGSAVKTTPVGQNKLQREFGGCGFSESAIKYTRVKRSIANDKVCTQVLIYNAVITCCMHG